MSIAYKENGVWKTVSGIPPIDNALSSTSENPVQNKIVKQAVDGKSDTGHNHDDKYYTESEVNNLIDGLQEEIDAVRGYVIVASTGSSSDTYKNKILSLTSAFNNLSTTQKLKSFLLISSRIYKIQSFASTENVFVNVRWGNTTRTRASFYIIDMVTGNRKEAAVKSDGVEIVDTTDNSTSVDIKLGYWT